MGFLTSLFMVFVIPIALYYLKPEVDMQNVKDRLGHCDIKTTMDIYAHVTKTARDKTADLFGEFMESNSL